MGIRCFWDTVPMLRTCVLGWFMGGGVHAYCPPFSWIENLYECWREPPHNFVFSKSASKPLNKQRGVPQKNEYTMKKVLCWKMTHIMFHNVNLMSITLFSNKDTHQSQKATPGDVHPPSQQRDNLQPSLFLLQMTVRHSFFNLNKTVGILGLFTD